MKIIFDHQKFTTQKYGGISRYFVNLALNLYKLNNEVKIIAPLFKNKYLLELPKNIVIGKHIKFEKNYLSRAIFNLNNQFSKVYSLKINPDIIHETYFSSFPIIRSKGKRVLTIYDMIHEKFPNSFNANDPTSKLKKDAIMRADHIISISDSTKNDLIDIYGVKSNKITTIHLSWSPSILNKSFPKKENLFKKPYLLYVGDRNGYKNFYSLLKAFSLSKRINDNFNLIAFGSKPFNNEEYQQMNDMNIDINKVVHLTGDDNLLSSLYQNAQAFIFPSQYEGFGIPPLEAMINSCPVISSNTSSMPEVIDNAAEYFDPKSLDNLIYAIENVVFSDSRKKELIKLGQERVSSFSWEKCAKETLRLYQSLN
tara:strand:- start:32366 stop:33469 length:1104 start_codon:yes stop_codon:yes gene_type:complete